MAPIPPPEDWRQTAEGKALHDNWEATRTELHDNWPNTINAMWNLLYTLGNNPGIHTLNTGPSESGGTIT